MHEARAGLDAQIHQSLSVDLCTNPDKNIAGNVRFLLAGQLSHDDPHLTDEIHRRDGLTDLYGRAKTEVVIFPTNLCLESTDRSRQAAAGRLHPPRQPMSPGAETSVPGPYRAVGRGQEVSLRSVPVYMQRPSAKNDHNGAQDGQRAPSLPGVPDPGKLTTDGPDTEQTPPETDVTAVPGTADATRPI
ncbi:hypothetical protein Bbelb_369530 [Branchiostoma belcheri]|nr:hypothetical protein Bbelb_369530 [Branchiostoma belcheri]